MSDGNKKQSFWKKWRFKYRFVVLNSETFEERLAFNMSRLNVFLLTCVSLTLLIGGTTLIIAFTPLREYIPRMTEEITKLAISNTCQISLPLPNLVHPNISSSSQTPSSSLDTIGVSNPC